MNDHDDIKTGLAATPGWEGLNAYDRTKRLCAVLTRRGERIPSWTAIRGIIGKGSSGDINRAKDDYRQEHAASLKKMTETLKGVPSPLVPIVMDLWTEAVAQARQEFDGQRSHIEDQLERAHAAQAQAELERDEARKHAETLQATVTGLEEANTALQGQVWTERATREQAERLFEATRAELAQQRDELRAALATSQQELSDAISRLEGAETHALMEIERARSRAASDIEQLQRKAERTESTHNVEKARLQAEINQLRERLAPTAKKVETLTHELAALRDRAERAEAQNGELIASLGKRSHAITVRRQRLNLKKR
ncbi:TPA: hypothetical protein HH296_17940 [Xanthomonas vasicola pv. zeae]|uniref:DNA-binding protein n=1 Tax=Xanthomonas TaxID=338 RepID=UPI0002E334F9|nr:MULTISPECIES: DNA-binding protein [Xanthomonas]KGT55153.1 hypothetical protein NY96_13490 [Xanthomonas citri pv. fuscans]HHZ24275.1 hypothetical protein [Xanthomonas vasicola pv. zeae]HHZ28503.1 hypothetical protein [Xanthomonas vasicola pv. zeae]HHZ52743.1 hypothetical protein [Xanthomonas vasicola pv. zeae]